MTGYYTLEHRL